MEIFRSFDEDLARLEMVLPEGPTLTAVRFQRARMYNKAWSPEGQVHLDRVAKEAFKAFSQSPRPTVFTNFVLIRARTLLKSMLYLGDNLARYEHIAAQYIASSNKASVYPGRVNSAYCKRTSRLVFTHQECADEYNAVVSKHRWDLCLARASRQRDLVGAAPRLSTVPKNARTNRTISVQPSGNLEVQRFYSFLCRDRLAAIGVHIVPPGKPVEAKTGEARVGTPMMHGPFVTEASRKLGMEELNMRMAKKASIDGSLATLDLQRASDSLSPEFLEFILPEFWAEAVKLCVGEPIGRVVLTMGCDLTFPLQTAIFLAVTMAATELCGVTPEVGVNCGCYGDDIVCPAQVARTLEIALTAAGCTVNREKSFSVGPFRESCGGWYHGGVDVKPFEAKVDITNTEPSTYAYVINGIMDWYTRIGLPVPYRVRKDALLLMRKAALPYVPLRADWHAGVRVVRPRKCHVFEAGLWRVQLLTPQKPKKVRALKTTYLIQSTLNGELAGGCYTIAPTRPVYALETAYLEF